MKPVMVPTSDVNSETAIVTAWHVRDRSQVRAGELVLEVETSKAVMDVVAPESGYLLRGAEEGARGIAGRAGRARVPERSRRSRNTPPRPTAAAMGAGPATSERVRATAPASRRAEELGVDLATLAAGELVTVKMVEAAAGGRSRRAAAELPSPLEAPSGVERVAVIGAGLGATQVIDIFASDPSKNGRRDRRRRPEPVGGQVGRRAGRGRHRSSWRGSSPRAASTPR